MKHSDNGTRAFRPSSCSVRAEPALLFRQQSLSLTEAAESRSDYLEEYRARVRHERDTTIVAAVRPVFFLCSTLSTASRHRCGTRPSRHTRVITL